MTQKDVAETLHINRSTLAYYETGKTQPDYDSLLQLAEMFGTTVQAMLTEDMETSHH